MAVRPASDFVLPEVFGRGNDKLGAGILTFSLPAITTCPGSSGLCRALCYADKKNSRFSGDVVQARYDRNWVLAERDDFAEILAKRLQHSRTAVLRWHVSGDVYNAIYATKILQVTRKSPQVQAYLYTRSWRDPAVAAVLSEIAREPNIEVWYSCDRETGIPQPPPRARTAYMLSSPDDTPQTPVDLVFRTDHLRHTVQKYVAGSLVCPVENGVSKAVQCTTCRICFSDPAVYTARRTRNRRSQ